MTAPQPITQHERIEVVDVLRGLAVCGILIGNMQWFSGYGMMPPAVATQAPIADQVTHFFVHAFVEGKFYSIFSFLFGFGFALQIARAEARDDEKASVFKRRLLWLLVIGLLHAWLLWPGDILSIYAVMGFLLLLFRKTSDRGLIKWAAILLIVPIVTYVILFAAFVLFAPPETRSMVEGAQVERWNSAIQTVAQGSFWQILTGYNPDYLFGRYMGLIFQMRLPKILAMFLLGYYAYRRGFFQDPIANKPLIRKVLVYGLVLGVAVNLLFAFVSKSEADLPPTALGILGVALYAIGVPALALGIAALITTLWQNVGWQRILGIFAPVGRMALTNYLLQTVICVLLFYGYGFGLFGRFGALISTLIALGIFAFQIVLSAFWLHHFNYGPMEWVWRCLTYRRRIGLIKGSA
jgi:uncharacterized protein